MNNDIFIDSSLLIEYAKDSKADLLEMLLLERRYRLCISQTVASEYLFHHLAVYGLKSPRTIKENRSIAGLLTEHDPTVFLSPFHWLDDEAKVLPLAVDFMRRFNLLPNDALILALCKRRGAVALASFDPDFEEPCRQIGLPLLSTAKDFERLRA